MGRKGKGNRSNHSSAKDSSHKENSAKVVAKPPIAIETTALFPPPTQTSKSLSEWLYAERQSIFWVFACAFVGALLGFGIGTGHLTGAMGEPVTPWRMALGSKIRATWMYQAFSWLYPRIVTSISQKEDRVDRSIEMFSVLREAVVRERGGFVHPDLGILEPAPSGAPRGLGMVRKGYHECQTRCMPGTASEKSMANSQNPPFAAGNEPPIYMQEEVLLKIPLSYQMTRQVALDTLTSVIPREVLTKYPLNELDDAPLLVLLLTHEHGKGRASRWLPYISSLPTEGGCGYMDNHRPYILDTVEALREEIGINTHGWSEELIKASAYAQKITTTLNHDYGLYLKSQSSPGDNSVAATLQWAMCQVASRAIAGSEKNGSLRLVPIVDLINHDANAGSFVELTGKESMQNGFFMDATEGDNGTFVIRSLRHGKHRPLKRGQELMANYNVPGYTALDWMVNSGFVPPERWRPWQKVDAALPRVGQTLRQQQQHRMPPSLINSDGGFIWEQH